MLVLRLLLLLHSPLCCGLLRSSARSGLGLGSGLLLNDGLVIFVRGLVLDRLLGLLGRLLVFLVVICGGGLASALLGGRLLDVVPALWLESLLASAFFRVNLLSRRERYLQLQRQPLLEAPWR